MKPEDGTDDPWYPASLAAWTEASDSSLQSMDRPLERYHPTGELGRGGMGVVHSAMDIWLAREVAIKRPVPGASDQVRRRAMREAAITARLIHPCIVPVFDVGEDEEGPYYTMPVLVGDGLDESLGRGLRGLRVHIWALTQCAQALGYAHRQGFIHRDVKPSNILVGRHGEVWMLDWGVAYDPEAPTRSPVGTPGFAAPEQVRGEPLTPAADVFSLGRCLAEIVAASDKELPELEAIVSHATQPEANSRYPNGLAFARELDNWMEGRQVAVHEYPILEVIWLWVRRRKAIVATVMVAACLGLTGWWISADAQRAERERGDEAFAALLAEQAQERIRRHAWSEAAVLASRSVAMRDGPVGRGLLMAVGNAPMLNLVSSRKHPCSGARWFWGDSIACDDGRLAQRGAITDERAIPEARQDDLLLHQNEDGALFWNPWDQTVRWWWRASGVIVETPGVTEARITNGPVPGIQTDDRIGRVEADGSIRWTEPICDRISSAWIDEVNLLVGCREEFVYAGTFGDLGEPIQTAEPASIAAWATVPVFGTFGGQLFTIQNGEAQPVYDSGVGVPVQLEPLADSVLVVRGERGRARLWDAVSQSFEASIPGVMERVRVIDEHTVEALGEEMRTWRVESRAAPSVYDRVSQGGFSFVEFSPSGEHMIAGSGTGEVGVFDVGTGAFTRIFEKGLASAKGGVFLDEETVIFSVGPVPPRRMRWRTGEAEEHPLPHSRASTAWGDGVLGLSWGRAISRITMDSAVMISLDEAPSAYSLGPAPLFATTSGVVYRCLESGSIDRLFTLPFRPAHLAGRPERLFVADGKRVVAVGPEGSERWSHTRRSDITAMHADDEWLVVGERRGTVSVYDMDGELVAEVSAHTRLISEVVIRGDDVFTASWDGTIRRLSLAVLSQSPAEIFSQMAENTGLSLQEAISDTVP